MHRPASNRWFLAFVPYKMAFGASSVALPLFVIRLGGGPVEVGLVTAASVASSIPASIAWARLSDRAGKRKPFIALSFLFNGITFALLAASTRVAELIVYSALQGVFVAAYTAASGMIVVESFPRARWEREFGVLSFVEGVAWTAGLLLGVAGLDLRPLFTLSALLLLLSLALSLIMIEEPRITLERAHLKLVVPRLHRNLPPRIHPPTLRGMLRVCRTLKDGLERNLAKHYAGTFAVFLGTNLLFTPLPAFMLERGVPSEAIFLIFFLNSAASTAFYLAVAKLSDRLGDRDLLVYALPVRSALFLLLAAAAAAPPPSLAALLSIALSAVGLTWSVVAVCTKALTPRLSAPMEEGRSVGVYNAVASLGSLVGALLSGVAVHACGYALTFALSAELMAFGAICFFLIRLRRPVVVLRRGRAAA